MESPNIEFGDVINVFTKEEAKVIKSIVICQMCMKIVDKVFYSGSGQKDLNVGMSPMSSVRGDQRGEKLVFNDFQTNVT